MNSCEVIRGSADMGSKSSLSLVIMMPQPSDLAHRYWSISSKSGAG